jgi:hypothetical protein
VETLRLDEHQFPFGPPPLPPLKMENSWLSPLNPARSLPIPSPGLSTVLCLTFTSRVDGKQVIPSNGERKITFFCAPLGRENSAIKIFSNEKFYGYDDGFGIRIKQRFSCNNQKTFMAEASLLLRVISPLFSTLVDNVNMAHEARRDEQKAMRRLSGA